MTIISTSVGKDPLEGMEEPSQTTRVSNSVCLVAQSCPTLCDPMDCSTPGSFVMGILQERILEWVATPSSRVTSQLRDWTQVSRIAGGFFTIWATREAQTHIYTPVYIAICIFHIFRALQHSLPMKALVVYTFNEREQPSCNNSQAMSSLLNNTGLSASVT